jgi:hypothetical protein
MHGNPCILHQPKLWIFRPVATQFVSIPSPLAAFWTIVLIISIEPISNNVLKGISSGLSIEGTGTICWKITTASGDEVSLHILNSLFVPSAPMCLLSPQTIAQHTKHASDGFHATSNKGTFVLAGFHKTIFYYSHNNLRIFFASSNLSLPLSTDLPTPTASHTALLSASEITTITALSPIQQKLLLNHQQMGHLHMAKIQTLAREGVWTSIYMSRWMWSSFM